MPEHEIRLHGCDDGTSVTADLTEDELALLKRVAEQTRQASEFSCQPYMTVDGIGADHHD